MKRNKAIIIVTSLLWCSIIIPRCQSVRMLPSGFVYVQKEIPDISYELRYYSTNNFMGGRVDAYQDSVLILSKEATQQLKKVQRELRKKNLGLKVFDAYRPQSAVDHFIRWAKIIDDTLMKSQYYPELTKDQLFPLGYISTRSGHTRGSTVDLTLIDMTSGEELDMGGPYDYFGELSHHAYKNINEVCLKNRLILKEHMMKHGFRPYKNEWWHYTLNNEPYPDTYFDFKIVE